MKHRAILLILLPLVACDALPKDPAGTLRRIETTRTIHVGLAGGDSSTGGREAHALIDALATRTHATARIVSGSAEPLLVALRAGHLDLVVAPFADDTPWATEVALSPPIAVRDQGDERLALRAAMRNGENRWIMAVEKSARQVAPAASRQ